MPIPLGILAAAGFRPSAAGDFVLLESTTLTSAQSSVEFTNLATKYASTYQHLQLRVVARDSRSQIFAVTNVTLNNDTSNNYAEHSLRGNGSSVSSGASTSRANIRFENSGNTAGGFGGAVIDLLDPFETKNKTLRILFGRPESGDPVVQLTSGLYMNTSSVTAIKFTPDGGFNYVAGSRFSLYGLRS
jgi:hypothetical protein